MLEKTESRVPWECWDVWDQVCNAPFLLTLRFGLQFGGNWNYIVLIYQFNAASKESNSFKQNQTFKLKKKKGSPFEMNGWN